MSVYDLRDFGWEGCIVPVSLENICRYIPSWSDILTLRSHTTAANVQMFFPKKFFHSEALGNYMPGYLKGKTINRGSYANVFKGKRALFTPTENKTEGIVNMRKTTDFEIFCIKEIQLNITPYEKMATPKTKQKAYEDEINAIIYEAFLHALLIKTFESHGFPTVVPRLYEMTAHTTRDTTPPLISNIDSIWLAMEFIQGTTLDEFFQRNLIKSSLPEVQRKNEQYIIDVFLQLAFFLNIVQEKLRFNHRDLKVNNLLIRSHSSPWSRILKLPNGTNYSCLFDIVFIDFGFACIACDKESPNPRASRISAGSWFRPEHDCFKEGRDIAQFVYSVHASFTIQEYTSKDFFATLYKSLTAEKKTESVPLLNGFDNLGNPTGVVQQRISFNNGIYIFMRDSDVDIPGCSPVAFMNTLASYIVPPVVKN